MLPLLLQTTEGSDVEWPEAAIAVAAITFAMMIVVVAIWQVFGTWRARMSIAREEAYRKLAEENLSAQSRMAVQQERIAQDVASLNERVAGIERVLREVN